MKPFAGWFEITGKDGPALQHFYSKLSGWSITFTFVADPEAHAAGLSRGAGQ
jgi:predicted enzyme related to lactoylglutathione lyase